MVRKVMAERQLTRDDGEARWAQARAEGEVAALVRSILKLLGARGVIVSPEARRCIETCQDIPTLDRWLFRTLTARTIEHVFGVPRKASRGASANPLERAVRDARGRKISLTPIRPLLDRIISRWNPYEVWLFGSRARGNQRPDSDWDLFVVVPDETSEDEFDTMVTWQMQKESGVHADIILCRESDFDEDRATTNTICNEVALEGVLIHER